MIETSDTVMPLAYPKDRSTPIELGRLQNRKLAHIAKKKNIFVIKKNERIKE